MVVTDTCSVWNILSARRLFVAAASAKVTFCVTPMVLYECLVKPRKRITQKDEELKDRLRKAKASGSFPEQPCDLSSLLEVARTAPKGLSSGELSCIATAIKMPTLAFMSDEKQARYHAKERLRLRVETTPRLYAWLHFHRQLEDGDHATIVSEHEHYERRPLTRFLNEAYAAALQHRLINQQQ